MALGIGTRPLALPGARVAVAPAGAAARSRDSFFAFFGAAWLIYTWWFPRLAAAHLVLPPCPFYALTGQPCPFCGGTRSFAAMWQGDVARAAHLYPFGPALFVLTFPVALYGLLAVATGRTLRLALHPLLERWLIPAAGALLLVSWLLKLLLLGNR